jgi:hypothetical protein
MPAPIEFKDLLRAKLPFRATLKRAYLLTFSNLGQLVTLSWKWLVLLLPFQLLFYWHAMPALSGLYAQIGQPVVTPLPLWISFGMIVLGLVSYVVFSAPAVGWHRLILQQIQPSGVMEVDQPTWRYAGYILLLYGLFNLPVLAQQGLAPAQGMPNGLQMLGFALSTVAMWAAIIVLFRLLVFLPGVAIDDPRASLNNVWQATRGHTLRLLFGNILAAAPFTLLGGLATYFIITKTSALTATLLMPLTTWLMYLGVAVGLTFTSLAYRFFYLDDRGATAV